MIWPARGGVPVGIRAAVASRSPFNEVCPNGGTCGADVRPVLDGPEGAVGVATDAPGCRGLPLNVATPGGLECACCPEAAGVGLSDRVADEVGDLRVELSGELHCWLFVVCSRAIPNNHTQKSASIFVCFSRINVAIDCI